MENCKISFADNDNQGRRYIFGATQGLPCKGSVVVKDCEFYYGVNNYSPNHVVRKFSKYDGSYTLSLLNTTITIWYSSVVLD